MPDIDLARTTEIIRKHGTSRDVCINILQDIQGTYGYLPMESLQMIIDQTEISQGQIYGVASFYEQFRFTPIGKHLIRVCHGTACHVNGSELIDETTCRCLGIEQGGTTEDGLFTHQRVACLGCCSLAPMIMIDDTVYGRLTPDQTRKILKKYQDEDRKEAEKK
jgi:NADH-quinone oxidoreductase subunit E